MANMDKPTPSSPRAFPSGSSPLALPERPGSPVSGSWSRAASNARLASPIPSYGATGTRTPTSFRSRRESQPTSPPNPPPLAGLSAQPPITAGPGSSALASALSASLERSPHRQYATMRSMVEGSDSPNARIQPTRSNHGSFSHSPMPDRSSQATPVEDFNIIRKHLAGPSSFDPHAESSGLFPDDQRSGTGQNDQSSDIARVPSLDGDNFSSLRMQGGDITRAIYRRTEAETARQQFRYQRSQSFREPRPTPEIENIKKPGGFRREHLRRSVASPAPGPRGPDSAQPTPGIVRQPSYITSNFFEFLTIYGHFAGEAVDEDETESDEATIVADSVDYDHSDDEHHQGRSLNEQTPLIRRRLRRTRSHTENGPKKGVSGTVLILLKSFVGTGVLFLPRAFLNGGMLFSVLVLLFVAILSNYCFILLTTSRLALGGSFAEMGEIVHGRTLRFLINSSLVISQIGFASAYIVFTSENLQAFILAVSKCKTFIDIKWMVLMQMVVFLPLSLYRNLNRLAFVVYIADFFIVLGLIYLYYSGISTIVGQGGVSDIHLFNKNSWTLFIGTAIFTFEGIGLIIPIQDGMKKPSKLPTVLAGVMVLITIIFTSMGALCYAAYGSKTKTVIILNMPQDNKFVNGVQFVYSLAILLSTPLQIYPVITIMEKGIFTKSGKFNRNVKWQKNVFRFLIVVICAVIAWVGANDLDKFVALVGSFACIPLVYIYPPLIHRKAVARTRWARTGDLALCAFGILLMAYTSVLTISSWIQGHGGGKVKGYCDKK